MMRKMNIRKIAGITLALGVTASGVLLQASSLTKTLKAAYNNIAISYNGQIKTLSSEPFSVNGTTYVPLRAVGEIMGSTVNWANNTVYITSQTIPTVSNEQELAAKNFEIASLKQQLEVAKKELETYKGNGTTVAGANLTTSAVKETLEQIEEDYDYEYSLDWSFDLKIVSNRLELTVYYEDKDDIWEETTKSERKGLIEDICDDIAYRHDDVEIRGTLEDNYEDEEIGTFKYSTSGSLTYDEEEEYSLSDFEDQLEDDYDKIDCFDFDIEITSIELDEEEDDEVHFTIDVDLGDYVDEWNELDSSSDEDELAEFLDEIVNDIEREFDEYDYILGNVYDESGVRIAYYDEDGDVTMYKAD
jgi:hypothetical protein